MGEGVDVEAVGTGYVYVGAAGLVFSDPYTPPTRSTKMKHSIYIVTIHGTDHPVRATGKRAAQQAAIEDRVSTRLASADDIVRICRSNARIIGDEADAIDEAVAQFNHDTVPAAQADTNEA